MILALLILAVLALLIALIRDCYYRPRRRSSEPTVAARERELGRELVGSPDRSTRRTREQKDELRVRSQLYARVGVVPPGSPTRVPATSKEK